APQRWRPGDLRADRGQPAWAARRLPNRERLGGARGAVQRPQPADEHPWGALARRLRRALSRRHGGVLAATGAAADRPAPARRPRPAGWGTRSELARPKRPR